MREDQNFLRYLCRIEIRKFYPFIVVISSIVISLHFIIREEGKLAEEEHYT